MADDTTKTQDPTQETDEENTSENSPDKEEKVEETTEEDGSASSPPSEEEVEEEVKEEVEKEVEEKTEEEVKEEVEEKAKEEDDSTSSPPSEEEAEEEDSDDDKEDSGMGIFEEEIAPGKTKGKQARGTGKNWYVIHTYSGYEDAVEKSLRQRIETFNMQDYIFDIVVPKESAISIKKGSHVTEKIRMFPGYVLISMIVTDDSWYVVRNTPNVTGFVGSGTIPVPVLPEEFDRIKKHTQAEEPKYKITFQIGENVEVIDGPFKDCEGLIDDIDERKGRAKILVNVFGRETPIELEFIQIKKK